MAGRFDATVLRVLTHLGALIPLAVLLTDFAGGRLSVNPIEDVQLRTGRYALLMLLLSLAATPASRILRLPRIKPLRKTLGLYAFGYAGLHMLNFIGLDYRFDVTQIGDGILEKPFVLAGIAALLALVPLAITSTAGWRTRLGKKWPSLHRLVYLAIVLSLVHFTLQEKGDFTRPAMYGAAVAALLLVRLPLVRQVAEAVRARFSMTARQRPPAG
ncbi:MAG: ferric reductase-like transmembrane domain-containing protein [Dehalococcoidales bacterium]